MCQIKLKYEKFKSKTSQIIKKEHLYLIQLQHVQRKVQIQIQQKKNNLLAIESPGKPNLV